MVRHWTGSYKHSPWHRPHGTRLHICLGQDHKGTVQQQLQQRGYITKIQAIGQALDRLILAQSMARPLVNNQMSGQALDRLMKAQSVALTTCKVSDVWSGIGQAHESTVHGTDHVQIIRCLVRLWTGS